MNKMQSAPQVTPDMIDDMVRHIVAEADPEQVVLFGSRGRGDAGRLSDVDLVVVEAEPFGPGRSRHREIMRLRQGLRRHKVRIDLLVYSIAEVDYWRDSLNHVLARALREGRVMYERQSAHDAPARPWRLPGETAVDRADLVCAGAGAPSHPRARLVSDVKSARMLLELARSDLIVLEEATRRVRDDSFGYHVQQATEKALKAWLAALGRRYPFTHELGWLFDLLAEAGAKAGFHRPLADFAPYAVDFRYMALGPDHEPIDRDAATARVRALLQDVAFVIATTD